MRLDVATFNVGRPEVDVGQAGLAAVNVGRAKVDVAEAKAWTFLGRAWQSRVAHRKSQAAVS